MKWALLSLFLSVPVWSQSTSTQKLDAYQNTRLDAMEKSIKELQAGRFYRGLTLPIEGSGLTFPDGTVQISSGIGFLTTYVELIGDNMTGQLTTASTITIQGDAFSVGTSTLVVKNGRVGIGTTEPAYSLHVLGGSYSSGQKIVGGSLTVTNASVFGGGMVGDGGSLSLGVQGVTDAGLITSPTGISMFIDSNVDQTGQSFRFYTDGALHGLGTEIMRVEDTGDVGIGTTDPSHRLEVVGKTRTDMRSTAGLYGDLVGADDYSIREWDPLRIRLGLGSAFGDIFQDVGLGLIGISTGLPQASLHISGDSSGLLLLVSSETAGSKIFSVNGDGNVGVRTTAPTYPLQVAGGAYASGQLIVGGSMTVAGNAFSVNTDDMYVSGGKVGIGTTDPATGLDVNVLSTFRSSVLATGGAVRVGEAAVIDGLVSSPSTLTIFIDSNSDQTGQSFRISTDAEVHGAGTELMRIEDGGDVGIGTTNPDSKLHVHGTINAPSINITPGGLETTTSTTSLRIGGDSSTANRYVEVQEVNVGDTNSNAMALVTCHGSTCTEKVRVAPQGNVGIGTTSPDQALHISGAADTYLVIEGRGANSQDRGIEFQNGSGAAAGYIVVNPNTVGTDSKMQFYVGGGAGGDIKMTVTDDGRVGISSSTPSRQLSIHGTGDAITSGIAMNRGADDTEQKLNIYTLGGADGAIFETVDRARALSSGVNTYFRQIGSDGTRTNLTLEGSSGNVGIGTTDPASLLEVAGVIHSNTGGFKFPDGTVQLSAGIGAGQISTGTYNVFNSSNDFRATTGFGNSITGTTGRHPITVWAKSVDGATQSSGCVVALAMSSAGNASSENAFMQFTSTTSASQFMPGVLFDNTCAPGAYCRVAVGGLVRAKGKTGMAVGNCAITSDTRCQSATGSSIAGTDQCSGVAMSATGTGGEWFWLYMGTK